MPAITTLERAFELSRAGACSSMADLARVLKRERFDAVDSQLAGPSLRMQLRSLMLEARTRRAGRDAGEAGPADQ